MKKWQREESKEICASRPPDNRSYSKCESYPTELAQRLNPAGTSDHSSSKVFSVKTTKVKARMPHSSLVLPAENSAVQTTTMLAADDSERKQNKLLPHDQLLSNDYQSFEVTLDGLVNKMPRSRVVKDKNFATSAQQQFTSTRNHNRHQTLGPPTVLKSIDPSTGLAAQSLHESGSRKRSLGRILAEKDTLSNPLNPMTNEQRLVARNRKLHISSTGETDWQHDNQQHALPSSVGRNGNISGSELKNADMESQKHQARITGKTPIIQVTKDRHSCLKSFHSQDSEMSQQKHQSQVISRTEEVRLPEMTNDSRKGSKLQNLPPQHSRSRQPPRDDQNNSRSRRHRRNKAAGGEDVDENFSAQPIKKKRSHKRESRGSLRSNDSKDADVDRANNQSNSKDYQRLRSEKRRRRKKSASKRSRSGSAHEQKKGNDEREVSPLGDAQRRRRRRKERENSDRSQNKEEHGEVAADKSQLRIRKKRQQSKKINLTVGNIDAGDESEGKTGIVNSLNNDESAMDEKQRRKMILRRKLKLQKQRNAQADQERSSRGEEKRNR